MIKEKAWLEVEKHEGELTALDIDNFLAKGDITKREQFKDFPGYPHHFLAIGDDPFIEQLVQHGWTGLSVYPVDRKLDRPRLTHKRIKAFLNNTDHLMPVFGGHYVQPLTIPHLFNQFPGPYGVISINWESMNRMLWEEKQIQDHLPYVYVLPEDGHNEGVMHLAWDRGYSRHHYEDRLVLVKDFVMEG